MRILYMGLGDTLIGRHLPQSWPDRLFRSKVGEHEVVTFGYAPDLDIQVPHDACFEDVLAKLPPGWVPDVCVCVHVDYLVIPPGIENAPFPTVAVTADWDFRIGIARSMAEAFDMTVALGDASCRAMKSLGARWTVPFAYFGVPEEQLQGELEDIDRYRPIDILFTGTIHDDTHLDRSKWLYRLSQLSKKYRIHIGEASSAQGSYLELLKRSKLVFTFHRRGEIQLRFTDAVTHGAAVLDCGVQTAGHFDAATDYLHYDEDNFERLIEQHLADDDLRRRKVEAARARTAREFGSVHRLSLLFDRIGDELSSRAPGPRPAQLQPPAELQRRIAEQHYANHFDCSMGPSERYLPIALAAAHQAPEGARRDNDIAVISYSLARHGSAQDLDGTKKEQALVQFEALVAKYPAYAMAWFNAGYAFWSEGRASQASSCFSRAYDLLIVDGADLDPWALYGFEQHLEPHGFKKAYNDALFDLVQTGRDERVRSLIGACCAYFLSRYQGGQGFLFEAYDMLCCATALDPGRGEFARRAAHAADVLGYHGEALQHYDRALQLLPLSVEWRLACISFLTRTGQLERGKTMLYEALDLLRATKGNEHLRDKASFLASAMSHVHAGTPVLGELLGDQFATAALAELCERLYLTKDPRIEDRVLEILREQGKTRSADQWAESITSEQDLTPGAAGLLSDHRERQRRQNQAQLVTT